MKELRIILLGFGGVGQAVVKLLERKQNQLLQQHGLQPRVVAIIDSQGAAIDKIGINLEAILKVKQNRGSVSMDEKLGLPNYSAKTAITSLDADVIVEVTPTNLITGEPGLSHIITALTHKRHVITVNKGPLALAFLSLCDHASYNNALLRFRGAVGGGIPVLDLGKTCFLGDHIHSIQGVLNGTTNYILSRMTCAGISKHVALKEAQTAGYAEADTKLDLEGCDSGAKLVILANYVLNHPITFKDVDITGINDITLTDIQRAKRKKRVIKLVATVNDRLAVVKPQTLPTRHPLNVHGTLNAVTFSTENRGDITIVGKGAGSLETASAIISDLIDIYKHIK